MYRKVDELGRIVLPAELRRMFGIQVGDQLEIYVDEGDRIVLEKMNNHCALCGSTKRLAAFKDRSVCANCRKQLAAIKTG